MTIFRLYSNKLLPVSSRKFDLEKNIQKLTEENLEILFGIKFVSGSLNHEFSIGVAEQDFYIDTLAFDENQKSIVIIEYKKDKSFSVIDQGFAYLSAVLNHKADLILELNERLNKNFRKSDIGWEATRVIFISPEFTNYQRNAINFKDLPIFLYEVNLYEKDLIEYDPIKSYRTTESITKISKDKTIQKVSREIKTYSLEDLIKDSWPDVRILLEEFEHELKNMIPETVTKYTKLYIAYMSKHGRNYVEIVPQALGLKVYFRFPCSYTKSFLKLKDCSKVGRWTNGNSYIHLENATQIHETVRLSTESYNFLHKDINHK